MTMTVERERFETLTFSNENLLAVAGHRHVVQLAELMTGSPLPAPLTAVLAAVAARTQREGSLAPECRMLRSVIPEGQMVTCGNR